MVHPAWLGCLAGSVGRESAHYAVHWGFEFHLRQLISSVVALPCLALSLYMVLCMYMYLHVYTTKLTVPECATAVYIMPFVMFSVIAVQILLHTGHNHIL